LALKSAMCSELLPIKLTVRTLPPPKNCSGREALNLARNNVNKLCDYLDVWRSANMSQLIQYHNPVQSSPIMKLLKKRTKVEPYFTPVNLHRATYMKDVSVCESLETLEIHITALE